MEGSAMTTDDSLDLRVNALGPPPDDVSLRDFYTENLGYPDGEIAFRMLVLANVKSAIRNREDSFYSFKRCNGNPTFRHPDVFTEIAEAECDFNEAILELTELACKQNPSEEDTETLDVLIKEVSEHCSPEYGRLDDKDTSYLFWAFWLWGNRPPLLWRILKNQRHSLGLDRRPTFQRTLMESSNED